MAHHGDLLLNKRQAKSYRIIKVARDEDLFEQIGKDINFDLVDHDKVHSFRIKKHRPFHFFKEEVAKEFGVPVQFQRFWLWAKRQNHTYRPNRPLTPQEESQSVGQLREVTNKAYNAELKLLLEVELGLDLQPSLPLDRTKEDIMLFFKLYDPEKEELRYVGRLFVKGSGKPLEVLAKLNEMAGFGPEEEIELYEEIKFEPTVMCEHIDKKLTFRSSQLEDGDIICFQKPPPVDNQERCRYPDVPSFLEYVHNLQVVHFRSLEKPKEDDFCLELSKIFTYDDVTKKVARQLGLDDATKLRLTSHNYNSQQPKPQPIKYRGVNHLSDMLVHSNQTSDILYYEVLDIPLPELQGLKTLKVAFHHATKDEVVIHSIRLPKQSTVGDVINDLKTKVELSNPDAELRLLEVFYHKIYKIFPLAEKIQNINDQYWKLRAEEIPEEEKNLGPQDCLIHVYHFTKDPSQNQMQVQNFGEPFFLIIHEGETLAEVKLRIQKKLQVPDEEFSKWKIAFLSLGRPDYLQDSDIVFNRFRRRDLYGAWEQYLGLEHSDSAPKRAYAANQIEKCSEKESSWSSEVSVSMPSSGSSKGGFAVQTLATDLQAVGIAKNSMTTPQTGGVSENLITRVAEANAHSSVTLPSQTEGVANLVTPQSDIHSISRSAQIASQQDQDLFALDYFSVSSEGSHSSFKELTDVSGFKVPTKFASLYKSVHTRYGHIATTKVLRNSTSALILKVTDILKVIEAMACRRVSDLDITTLEYWDGHIQDAEALQFNVTWLRERLDSVSDEWKKVTELRNSVATSDTALKSAIMYCDTLKAFVQDLQKQFDLVTQNLDEAKSALNSAENQVQVEQEALRAGMEQHALLQSLIQNTLLHDL